MAAAHQSKRLVVKIDVEGFEGMVLSGMSTLLQEQRCRKVIVEVNPGRASSLDQSSDIDQMMAGYGYIPVISPAGRVHFDQCYRPQV
jgi:acetylglutamate kinase